MLTLPERNQIIEELDKHLSSDPVRDYFNELTRDLVLCVFEKDHEPAEGSMLIEIMPMSEDEVGHLAYRRFSQGWKALAPNALGEVYLPWDLLVYVADESARYFIL